MTTNPDLEKIQKELIKGVSKKEYFKAYREQNKDKIAEKEKAYREQNKDKKAEKGKAYREQKKEHKKEHPEEYTNVLGKMIYTNGVTEEIKRQLPELIDKKVKEMLSQ